MQFAKTELKVLEQIGNGNKQVINIARTLKKSRSQIYQICEKLREKGIITLAKGVIEPTEKTQVNLLMQILVEFPNLVNHFSGAGLKIYTSLLKPKTIGEIEKETKLHRATIFKALHKGRNISLAYKEGNTYRIGDIWTNAKECLQELKRYEEVIDTRVPSNAEIYCKNEKEILFSIREEFDATRTAFSVYKDYGIKIFTSTNYYYLPKKNLTKEEILKHSLEITGKKNEPRAIIYSALFYLKYYKECKKTAHSVLGKIKRVLEGEEIKGFPSLEEIKEKADIYKIKV